MLCCGGAGFYYSVEQRIEEHMIRQMIKAIEIMECEISYRLSTLTELCVAAANETEGTVSSLLRKFSELLIKQETTDIKRCMELAVETQKCLPCRIKHLTLQFAGSLGKFDIDGQLIGLESAKGSCERQLKELTANKQIRQRGYQTLGLCAGAAIIILLI